MLSIHEHPPLILVVEDVPEVRELLTEVLQSEGYAVVAAADGREAWNHLREGLRPDLILLDLLLPVMNGWELLQKKRGDRDLREIPVITLSALDAEPDELEQGCACHLRKPIAIGDLLAAVDRHRARRVYPLGPRRETAVPPTAAYAERNVIAHAS